MSDSTESSQGQEQNYVDMAKSAAGVLGGHAQLGQGAAQEQIGNLLNSEEWKKSGLDLKGEAGENIKKAFEDFKSQGGNEKASQLADQACPQTGDGIGDQK